MEIERKFLVKQLPDNLENYEARQIEQAYLCTSPVVRIRKKDEDYILTYKSSGMLERMEEEMPLTKESYEHLREKADGNIITKIRYLIPEENGLLIELDCFLGVFEGFVMAEVEFESIEQARAYNAPEWFLEEVTYDKNCHNSNLSKMSEQEIGEFLERYTCKESWSY
ncbi:MAG: CYTH domain-containing protein [Lachnospiraceae bacterium]